jgi:ribose transport system substrate-binding protein
MDVGITMLNNDLNQMPIQFIKKYKAYLITMDKIDQHWYSVDKGASEMAEITRMNYIWDAPEYKDNILQIEILNNAVANDADLILLAANDPVAISSAIEDAKSKGVKIIYVDSPAYEEAIITLATDNYNAGKTAGELMLNEFSAQAITSGSIGIIGVNRAINSTMNRELGFRDVLSSDGRFLLLPTDYEEGDPAASQEAAQKMITENSDLVGLFGVNEGSTEGVGFANQANNNRFISIGFDKSDIILNLIRVGSLNDTVAQNPFTMGYLGIAEGYAALNGYNTGPKSIDTGVAILSR